MPSHTASERARPQRPSRAPPPRPAIAPTTERLVKPTVSTRQRTKVRTSGRGTETRRGRGRVPVGTSVSIDPRELKPRLNKGKNELRTIALKWGNQLRTDWITDLGSGTQPLPSQGEIKNMTAQEQKDFLRSATVAINSANMTQRYAKLASVAGTSVLQEQLSSGFRGQSGGNLEQKNSALLGVITRSTGLRVSKKRVPRTHTHHLIPTTNFSNTIQTTLQKVEPTLNRGIAGIPMQIMSPENLTSGIPIDQVISDTPPEFNPIQITEDLLTNAFNAIASGQSGRGGISEDNVMDLITETALITGKSSSDSDIASNLFTAADEIGFALNDEQALGVLRAIKSAMSIPESVGGFKFRSPASQMQNPQGSMLPTNALVAQRSNDSAENAKMTVTRVNAVPASVGDVLNPVDAKIAGFAGGPSEASSSNDVATLAGGVLAEQTTNPAITAVERKTDFEPTKTLTGIKGAWNNALSLVYGDGFEDNSFLGNSMETALQVIEESKHAVSESQAVRQGIAALETGDISTVAQLANDVKDQVVGHVKDLARDPRQGVANLAKSVATETARRIKDRLSGEVPRDAPGVLDDLPGIIAGARDSAAGGGFSEGAGGVGNLPIPPGHRGGDAAAVDHNGNGHLSQAERDHMPFNERQLAYMHQYNPQMAGKLRGSTKIKKRKPRHVSARRARNQVDIVQQGGASAGAYRDIFKTTFQ